MKQSFGRENTELRDNFGPIGLTFNCKVSLKSHWLRNQLKSTSQQRGPKRNWTAELSCMRLSLTLYMAFGLPEIRARTRPRVCRREGEGGIRPNPWASEAKSRNQLETDTRKSFWLHFYNCSERPKFKFRRKKITPCFRSKPIPAGSIKITEWNWIRTAFR